jgi:hypothetical protein
LLPDLGEDGWKQDIEVWEDYAIYGAVSDAGTNERAAASLVPLLSMADPLEDCHISDRQRRQGGTETEQKQKKTVIDRYILRWGIETHKNDQEFPRLDGVKRHTVRLIYFGFPVLLYNIWLLVDLLVHLSFDIDDQYKPRLIAKRFLNLVGKQLSESG